MNYKKDSRVTNTRESFFDVLATYIVENPYEYTIHANDLCLRAGRSRMTFNRLYENVGDILKWADREVFQEFLELHLEKENLYISWRKIMIFILRHKMVFEFELKTYRGNLLRKIADYLWNFFEMSSDKFLFEMFYAEAFCVLRVWSEDGMKINNIDKLVFSLLELFSTIEERWGENAGHP